MEATSIERDAITVAFSPAEVVFLLNAVGEALEAVEDWEFQTRTGETRQRALELHAQLAEILNQSKRV
jgi:hypothetical protein